MGIELVVVCFKKVVAGNLALSLLILTVSCFITLDEY